MEAPLRFRYLKTIGEGGYGKVYECERLPTGERLAVKAVRNIDNPAVRRLVSLELRVLRTLPPHPCVVRLVEAFRGTNTAGVFMAFECMERNLLEELDRQPSGRLSGRHLRAVSRQAVAALAHCHAHGVLHRDIKPANLLISGEGEACVVKLCDFGFARFISGGADRGVGERLTSYVVTRWYRAPEILVRGPYGPPSDVWSLGATLAELATGQPLLPGLSAMDQLCRTMRACGPLPPDLAAAAWRHPHLRPLATCTPASTRTLRQRLQGVEPSMVDVIVACLSLDPARRPRAADLLQMPYFTAVPPSVPPSRRTSTAGTVQQQVQQQLQQQQMAMEAELQRQRRLQQALLQQQRRHVQQHHMALQQQRQQQQRTARRSSLPATMPYEYELQQPSTANAPTLAAAAADALAYQLRHHPQQQQQRAQQHGMPDGPRTAPLGSTRNSAISPVAPARAAAPAAYSASMPFVTTSTSHSSAETALTARETRSQATRSSSVTSFPQQGMAPQPEASTADVFASGLRAGNDMRASVGAPASSLDQRSLIGLAAPAPQRVPYTLARAYDSASWVEAHERRAPSSASNPMRAAEQPLMNEARQSLSGLGSGNRCLLGVHSVTGPSSESEALNASGVVVSEPLLCMVAPGGAASSPGGLAAPAPLRGVVGSAVNDSVVDLSQSIAAAGGLQLHGDGTASPIAGTWAPGVAAAAGTAGSGVTTTGSANASARLQQTAVLAVVLEQQQLEQDGEPQDQQRQGATPYVVPSPTGPVLASGMSVSSSARLPPPALSTAGGSTVRHSQAGESCPTNVAASGSFSMDATVSAPWLTASCVMQGRATQAQTAGGLSYNATHTGMFGSNSGHYSGSGIVVGAQGYRGRHSSTGYPGSTTTNLQPIQDDSSESGPVLAVAEQEAQVQGQGQAAQVQGPRAGLQDEAQDQQGQLGFQSRDSARVLELSLADELHQLQQAQEQQQAAPVVPSGRWQDGSARPSGDTAAGSSTSGPAGAKGGAFVRRSSSGESCSALAVCRSPGNVREVRQVGRQENDLVGSFTLPRSARSPAVTTPRVGPLRPSPLPLPAAQAQPAFPSLPLGPAVCTQAPTGATESAQGTTEAAAALVVADGGGRGVGAAMGGGAPAVGISVGAAASTGQKARPFVSGAAGTGPSAAAGAGHGGCGLLLALKRLGGCMGR